MYNTSTILRAAAIQMISTPDPDSNLAQAAQLIGEAAARGAELAVLPEFFPIIGNDERDKLNCQERFGHGPIQGFLARQAREAKLWLMGGTIPLQSEIPGKVYNSCLLYTPTGELAARYDKIHLFDVSVGPGGNETYSESNTMVAGDKVVVATTPLGRIGMSVCYDLRFPELYRLMSARGADMITVPSAFTETTGQRHWEMLLRTRAVENLCYVIAPNQGGRNTETRRTWGHSMIIDPWGEVLASMEQGTGVICADLDLARMYELRTTFPALQHRKF